MTLLQEGISLLVLLLVTLSSTTITTISAFPTGAGACPSHRPAVGGAHVTVGSQNIRNGTLEDGNVQVFVDSDRLRIDREYSVWMGKPTEILIRAPLSGKGIKGFLIRLGQDSPQEEEEEEEENDLQMQEAPSTINLNSTISTATYDLTSALQPQPPDDTNPYALTLVQVEDTYCAESNAAGLTHTDNTAKYIIKGQMLLEVPLDSLLLDVTVVLENTAAVSEFYYTQYALKVVDRNQNQSPSNNDDSRGPSVLVFGDVSATSSMMISSTSSFCVIAVVMTTTLLMILAPVA